jgi:hypothetical protein
MSFLFESFTQTQFPDYWMQGEGMTLIKNQRRGEHMKMASTATGGAVTPTNGILFNEGSAIDRLRDRSLVICHNGKNHHRIPNRVRGAELRIRTPGSEPRGPHPFPFVRQ